MDGTEGTEGEGVGGTSTTGGGDSLRPPPPPQADNTNEDDINAKRTAALNPFFSMTFPFSDPKEAKLYQI